jgi:hypothetical protein
MHLGSFFCTFNGLLIFHNSNSVTKLAEQTLTIFANQKMKEVCNTKIWDI